MPFVPNPLVAQVNLNCTYDNQECTNTMYFAQPTAFTAAALETLTSAVAVYWLTHMLPLQSFQVHLVSVKAQRLGSPTDLVHTYLFDSPSDGGNTSPALPNNVSLAIGFKTGLSGRSNQGRNYWIGLTENQVVGNQVASGTVDDIIDAYTDMFVNMPADNDWTPVVYSRYHNGSARATGLATPITSVVVTNSTVDSMRRRLPGRGR